MYTSIFSSRKEPPMNLINAIFSILMNTLLDGDVLSRARRRKGAFTRNNGKLPFWLMIKSILKNAKRTIASKLDEIFGEIAAKAGLALDKIEVCSHQAYSKARSGISHTIFKECFDRILDFLCNETTLLEQERIGGVWGIQPIAIDGSKIPLPARKRLWERYGGMGRDASSPTAIASVALDVLRGLILDAQFEPIDVDERTLAIRHMKNIRDKARANLFYTMFIFDRGYASEEMIRVITEEIHARYLFRLRNKFNKEIDALPAPKSEDDIVDATLHLYEGIRVRVIRLMLPGGTIETLITNSFGTDKAMFRYLYFKRWPVETEYDIIKQKVGLICFNGYAENSILQEFWISMLMANITSAIEREATGIIKGDEATKPPMKHTYKADTNEIVGCVSRHLPEYLDSETHYEALAIVRHILMFAVHNKVVDKKGSGESNPREEPRAVKYSYNRRLTH